MRKIHTKTVFDIETGKLLEDRFYEYDGPVAFCCGGDALASQKQEEANQQVQMNSQMMDLFKQYSSQTNPFWMNQLQQGLPFFNALTDYNKGTTAQAFAPAQAGLNRSLAGLGETLPSGMAEQAHTNLNAQEGQAFDQNMVNNLMENQQAKERAAGNLNPFQPAQVASGSAQSVLGAPPVNPGGFGNFLGGAVSGLFNASQAGGSPLNRSGNQFLNFLGNI